MGTLENPASKVSELTPEEAYRKGVEDAIALLHAHPMWAEYIRKTLLKDT